MSLDSRTRALQDLQTLGLLSEDEGLAAASHPRLFELAAQPRPQAALEWLLRVEVVAAHGLLEAAAQRTTGLDADALAARRSLVLDALRQINRESVDALLAEGLISQGIHQIISESLMTDRALLTPAATMALVVQARMMSWDEYLQMRARPANERSAAANAILAETAILVTRHHDAYKRAVWRQAFPGPRWLYFLGAPLFIAAAFWYVTPNRSVPDCDAEDTRKTLNHTLLMGKIKDGSILDSAPATLPSIRDLREVGYNKVANIRGCSGQMTVDKKTGAFAYTIAKNSDRQKGGFVLSGAEPDIVKARFGTLDANGDFQHKAEPIGRSALEQAFRAGTALLVEDTADRRAAFLLRAMTARPEAEETVEPRRDIDVEPTGICRAVKPGDRYVCPLLAEWDDPLITAVGRDGRRLLHGEFTFAPNVAGAPLAWRVSADFSKEFQRARQAASRENQELDVDEGASR